MALSIAWMIRPVPSSRRCSSPTAFFISAITILSRPVSDLEFSKQLVAAVRRLAERENHEKLDVQLTGGYAIAAASERAIRHDMITSVISSVVFLQLLFLFAYRRPIRSFAIAFLPVAIGITYGFGVYALLTPKLTPMTAVIGGILAGMAIDYAIACLS